MITLHALHIKLGEDLCHVLIKAHVLNGEDALSKIGTKHATLTCRSTRFPYFAYLYNINKQFKIVN